jgi:D-alanine transaminase
VFVERVVEDGPRRRGLAVVTMPDPRWRYCHLKTLVLLPNVLARQAAVRAGADEAVLLGPGGVVREGSTSNVFMVRGRGPHPLGGDPPAVATGDVGRGPRGLDVREEPFRLAALLRADEVLLSSLRSRSHRYGKPPRKPGRWRALRPVSPHASSWRLTRRWA